jgi:hypothetical protein
MSRVGTLPSSLIVHVKMSLLRGIDRIKREIGKHMHDLNISGRGELGP